MRDGRGSVSVLAVSIICAVLLIVVIVVLVLHAACNDKLQEFRFKFSATLAKIFAFGIEIESKRKPDELPPGEGSQ